MTSSFQSQDPYQGQPAGGELPWFTSVKPPQGDVPIESDLLTILPGVIYSFEGATLKATTPLPNTHNMEVATTEWVNNLLGVTPPPPLVMSPGGLNVTYTSGVIVNPMTNASITVKGTIMPIGVDANSIEYIWVRYLDEAVIATSVFPSNNQGYLLATVTTNNTDVISISHNTNMVGWAPINSPSFGGVVTVPSPAPTDNSNKVPTTSWVRGFVQTALMGSDFPTLSLINTGNGIIWSDGIIRYDGNEYPVLGGKYTFTDSTNGTIYVNAVIVGEGTLILVSSVEAGDESVLLGSVSVTGGQVGQVMLPPTSGLAPISSPTFTGNPQAPTPLLSDVGNTIATTEWVVDVVTTKMVVGFGGHVIYTP